MERKVIFLPTDFFVDVYIRVKEMREIFYRLGALFYEDMKQNKLSEILLSIYRCGWGRFQILWYSRSRIVIKGISVFAKQLRKYHGIQKSPVDDFILGVLDSWAEKNNLRIKFREIECIAIGSERCVFVGETPRPKHAIIELRHKIKGCMI